MILNPIPNSNTGVCTLLSKDLGIKEYKVCGKKTLNNTNSESSERLRILQRTLKIQDTFFKKFHEYRVQKIIDPGSLRTRQLFAECKVLKEESEELLKLV